MTPTMADVPRLLLAQHERMRALEAEVRATRAALDELLLRLPAAPAANVRPEDLAELVQLLPIAHREFGSRVWIAGELAAIAPRYADPAGAKRLGHLLKRCAGQCAAGLRLVAVRTRPRPPVFCVHIAQETPTTPPAA